MQHRSGETAPSGTPAEEPPQRNSEPKSRSQKGKEERQREFFRRKTQVPYYAGMACTGLLHVFSKSKASFRGWNHSPILKLSRLDDVIMICWHGWHWLHDYMPDLHAASASARSRPRVSAYRNLQPAPVSWLAFSASFSKSRGLDGWTSGPDGLGSQGGSHSSQASCDRVISAVCFRFSPPFQSMLEVFISRMYSQKDRDLELQYVLSVDTFQAFFGRRRFSASARRV